MHLKKKIDEDEFNVNIPKEQLEILLAAMHVYCPVDSYYKLQKDLIKYEINDILGYYDEDRD